MFSTAFDCSKVSEIKNVTKRNIEEINVLSGQNKKICTEDKIPDKNNIAFVKPNIPDTSKAFLAKLLNIASPEKSTTINQDLNEQPLHQNHVNNGLSPRSLQKALRTVQRKFPGPAGLLPYRNDLTVDVQDFQKVTVNKKRENSVDEVQFLNLCITVMGCL